MKIKKILKKITWLFVFLLLVYGAGRLYFRVTGGFRITHISSDFAYDPRWDTKPASSTEMAQVDEVLSQEFTYLGKGCQSYVFLSNDGEYVIKFFKYQRFRPQFYLYWFSFLPPVKAILNEKIEKKQVKREKLFSSWVTAFDNLPDQTGLVYVHLNKTAHLNKKITIKDKLDMKHVLNMDDMEFLIQKKATMLCATLDNLMADGKIEEAKLLLTNLVAMVIFEYQNGIADHDHALMQNTGVYQGQPIHIDVGQFEKNDVFRQTTFHYQELYNKMWKFRQWLKKQHPELLIHLDQELYYYMGDRFYEIQFISKPH